MRRWVRFGFVTLLLTLVTLGASAADPKRVLILNPYGRDIAPFSAVASAFRITLAQEFGEPVDIYELPLDLARFAESEGEQPLVDFLSGRLKQRPVNLVVSIGSVGVQFAARHREQLFPDTPMLFVAPDPRFIPAGFLRTNAALVTEKVNLPGIIQGILQLQPDTTNIVVVFGASKIEQAWVGECRREFQAFTNQVGFTWLDNLPLQQVLERCADLPPRSFIFHGLFIVDAAGIASENDEALRRLHAIANAPVFAYFASQFGNGPVGGRLYQDIKVGEQGARTAIRILRGERLENIPPQVFEAAVPVYDWRELQRWGIREANLPAGSVIQFRQPGFWELYGWWVIGGILFCSLQTALLVSLLVNQSRRRKGEDKIRQLSLAMEQSPVLLMITDLRGKIIYVNRKFSEVTGYSFAESIGQNPRFLKSGESSPETYRELWARITSGETWRGHFHNRKKNGELYWEAAVISPLFDAAGTVTHFVGIKEDITERRQIEAELLRQRAELAHIARVSTMGELAASVAHELNQPLGAILANAEAAELFLEQKPPAFDDLRATLADIRKDDERASAVIRRMRALLRKHELELQPLELNSIVEEVLQLVSGDAVLRRIALTADLLPFLPKVSGDRVHLQQVLLNLILNGMDATNGQPHERRQIQVRTRLGGDGLVELAVIDSGHGIDPDKLPRLFEPFFTTKPSGMGMGLSISRTIIEAHHGRIWAENNPSGGAVFRVTLSVVREGSKP